MSRVHPTTPKLGAAAGGCIAGNQHERVWLAAPSPRGNKESISRLAVFQRRARLGSAEEEQGWDLRVPPPSSPEGSGAWPRADKCMGLDVIYVYGRHEGEDVRR